MGCFSWMYATAPTSSKEPVNIVPGDKVKVLVPTEFGGGCIDGEYCGYGRVKDADGVRYDVHELLTLWNSPTLRGMVARHIGVSDDKALARKACDNYADSYDYDASVSDALRSFSIHWSHVWSRKTRKYSSLLRYDLKIARPEDDVTYEDCRHFSASDPDQGFWHVWLDNVGEYDGDLKAAWLEAVNPPIDPHRTQVEHPPIDADRLRKLEQVLAKG